MPSPSPVCTLSIGTRDVPLVLVPNGRARHYILRVQRGGVVRVTVPRGGSVEYAREFVARHAAWVQRQLEKLSAQPDGPAPLRIGSQILFRGEMVTLTATALSDVVLLGTDDSDFHKRVYVQPGAADIRREVEATLWCLADRELPPRVSELAVAHGLSVRRVTVRNQRSRWGSCSRRATISLNWRLIQAPAFVRDYIIIHELMHLREMNHSARFWNHVELACPDYRTAEKWLNAHASLLRP